MVDLLDPTFNEGLDDPGSCISHPQDSSILSYVVLFFFFCITMRTTVVNPQANQIDATKCRPLLSDRKFPIKYSFSIVSILDRQILSMATSMNSSAGAAEEMGKKDNEQESVNIARMYSRKLIRIILSHCFKVTSVIDGIDSLRLDINEKGQVSCTMLQFFSSHDDGFQ